MKKIFTLLTIVLMVLSLTSCADNEQNHIHGEDSSLLAGETDDKETAEDYDLTIALCGYNNVEMIIPTFEGMYNLKIRIIKYDSEEELSALDVKLMAEDDDIDIFYTASLPVYKYVRNGCYTDLNEFPDLKAKLDNNGYTKMACCYNGEYFGLSVDPHLTNEFRPIAWKYLADCVSLTENKYADQDGEELFNVLKYIYLNPDDTYGDGYYDPNDYNYVVDSYIIISPFSQNKETAALFLETAFDYFDGQLSYRDSSGNTYFSFCQYPDVGSVDNAYFAWDITVGTSDSVTKPVWDAFNSVSSTDGSDETLRKLAADAAWQVRQRLEG